MQVLCALFFAVIGRVPTCILVRPSPLRGEEIETWNAPKKYPDISCRRPRLCSARRASMRKKIIVPLLASLVLASVHLAQAQQTRVYRVGVIVQGGPDYVIVNGLKSGLSDLGFAEGKQYLLE